MMNSLKKRIGESPWFLALYTKAKCNDLSFCFSSKHHIDFFNSDPTAYEGLERKFIKRYVKHDDAVMEMGGCMGVVACETNRILDKPSRHLVVEANPSSAAYLKKNRDRNGCDFAIENSLISKSAAGEFFCDPNNPLASGQTSKGVRINVPVVSLTDVLAKREISPTALVMDIEGAEIDFILENIGDLTNLSTIICEFHPVITGEARIEEAHAKLREHGFSRKEHEIQAPNYVDVWVRSPQA